MFDQLVAGTTGACGADAAAAWTRVESAACARRLAAMLTVLDTAHAADGVITFAVVRAIVTRTANVVDPDALHALDEALAEALRQWQPMSVDRTEKAIDSFVLRVDPHALRRTETRATSRSVQVSIDDATWLAELVATLFAHDAVAAETDDDERAEQAEQTAKGIVSETIPPF